MKWLRFIFSHSIFVSLCAAALTFHTACLLGIDPDPFRISLVFFSTLLTYNLYWMVSFCKSEERHFWDCRTYGLSGILMAVIALAGTVVSLTHQPAMLARLTVPAVLTFLYFIPVLASGRSTFFKNAGPVKTLLLALAWSYVTVGIAFPSDVVPAGKYAAAVFFQRFFFMLMICIIFDSRDEATDKIKGLHSLATRVNRNVLTFIQALSFLFFSAMTFFIYDNSREAAHLAVSLIAGIAAVTLYFISRIPRGYFFYYFLVDGLMIVLAASSLICPFF